MVKVTGHEKVGSSKLADEGSRVSHIEAAARITKVGKSITTKEDARAFLREAGIFNSKNKLSKHYA